MSKSSGTNSPTLQLWSVCVNIKYTKQNRPKSFFSLTPYSEWRTLNSHKQAIDNGGNSDGDPPLPIPNREVKPVSADGTAIPSGRVGSRQLLESIWKNPGALFLYTENQPFVQNHVVIKEILE